MGTGGRAKLKKVEGRSIGTEPSGSATRGLSGDAVRLTPKGAPLFLLGGRCADIVAYEPRCKTCTHPQDERIHDMLKEMSAEAVAKWCKEQWANDESLTPKERAKRCPSATAIRWHIHEHLRPGMAVEMQIRDQQAVQAGIDLAETGSLVSPYIVLSTVMRKGYKDLVKKLDKGAPVSVSDMIRAAEIMLKMEQDTDVLDKTELLIEGLQKVITLASQFVSPRDLGAFAYEMEQDPVLRTLYGNAVETTGEDTTPLTTEERRAIEAAAWEDDGEDDFPDDDDGVDLGV